MSTHGHEILVRRELAPDLYFYEVHAPLVARARRAGQFMMVTPTMASERIPISIAGGDRAAGTVEFAVQRVGRTTHELCALGVGDRFASVLGPLGEPTHLAARSGVVLCIGGGYGAGAVVPIAEANRELGNRVIGIIGARDEARLIFVDAMDRAAHATLVCTEDGSAGQHGRVTDVVAQLLDDGVEIAHVYAIGPVPMMRALAEQTRALGIGCTVSLNALMVDGTGMCGGCRVVVDGRSRFACCDGPDFDAHGVDFDALVDRQRMYRTQEQRAFERVRQPHADGSRCRIDVRADELQHAVAPVLPDGVTMDSLDALGGRLRASIPRQTMPEQRPEIRVHNFDEVALGLTEDQAVVEAARCLRCKEPTCIGGCPVSIDIFSMLRRTAARDFDGAWRVLQEANCLPAISGRVCPQEKQCEAVCVLGRKHEPVAIGRVERFLADRAARHDGAPVVVAPATGRRAAVVGSGPAGLTVAGELARRGHEVVVYEALHRPGGVLVYGIPEFRLPNRIVDQEVARLEQMGVEIVTGALIGRSLTIEQLLREEGFDAVFLGTGAGLPMMMGIPGEDLKGSYTANEYLTRINLMRADLFPERATPVHVGEHVVVVGGGNTAMDCVRTSLRMGARSVSLVYRRGEAEMPARAEEIEHARQEGVDFRLLTQPVALLGDADGWVRGIECVRMELGEPDASGRRRPVEIAGSNFVLEAQTVVGALGFGVNPLLEQTTPGLEVDRRGVIQVDATRRTSLADVYGGGDATTGGATVILAMGQGKEAAEAMHRSMMSRPARRAAVPA